MNIKDLQAALRHFAAERDWQPFHTPKNLSTALMVEAAELADIFQWMTPEESLQVHESAETQGRVSHEIADVLLYLLQVADHTRVDVAQAVQDKLALNAQKHPKVRSIELVSPGAIAAETHVLLDYENVQPSEEEVLSLVPGVSAMWVFHGPHQKKVEARFTSFGKRLTLVPINKVGKNALDFHLSYYMGYITSRNPEARFVVLANDKGYDPMLDHARELGFAVEKCGYQRKADEAVVAKIVSDQVPMFSVVAASAAAKKAPAKKTVAKKATPKEAAPKQPVPKKQASAGKAKAPAKKTAVSATPKPVASAKPAMPAMATKIEASLRKMGKARPSRQPALKRMLAARLGVDASEDAVSALLKKLVSKGLVVIGSAGDITYQL